MGDGTFMNKNFIEELNEHPYESLMFKSLRGEFWIEESFTKTEYSIEGEIRCGIQGVDFWCGDVEVYIGIDRLKNKHCAGFGYLEVLSIIVNRGIGTPQKAMLHSTN